MNLIDMPDSIRIILTLTILLTTGVLSSCSHTEELEPEAPDPQIVFLFSPGGLGDMSYNDRILEGVQRFKIEHGEVDVYIYSPESISEAEKIFSDWLVRPESDIPVLFVLGSSDYEPMAERHLTERDLTPNKSILIFESKTQYKDEHIHTFQISMYGASYLAGACAKEITDGVPLVLLANDTDSPIGIAKDGFIAGYGSECDVEYLAEDWTGYVAATKTYQKMTGWSAKYGFIFPVAGGSNSGLYRYSREFGNAPYLAGMDIDQSGLSDKITGSVVKNIDRLIYEYLKEWTATGTMPEDAFYGLESGYVDWQVALRYESLLNGVISVNRQKAIDTERRYYEE